MKLTKAHIEYWMARRGPKCFAAVLAPKGQAGTLTHTPAVTVDTLINAQLPRLNEKAELAALRNNNALALCRSFRRRGNLRLEMERIADQPWEGGVPSAMRGPRYRRWLKRMSRTHDQSRPLL